MAEAVFDVSILVLFCFFLFCFVLFSISEAEDRPPLFIRRNNMKIPIAEYFSKPKSPPKPKIQENISTKPMSARSMQQGFNLSPQRAFYP